MRKITENLPKLYLMEVLDYESYKYWRIKYKGTIYGFK